jgi:Mce-associated membrane protein
MDDQQLDSDDLTGARNRRRPRGQTPRGKRARRLPALDADAKTAPEAVNADEDADATEAGDEKHDGAAAAGGGRLSRWHTVVIGIAALVFIGSVTYAGAAVHTYLGDRAAASTRTDVARTAVAMITTLWTYTPDTIDGLADRASEYLSGDFNAQYRKFLNAAAAPNKQAQVTDNTEVVGVGVESLHGSDAVALVFTNTTATSPLTKNVPSLKYVGYRLAMKQEGSRWLVTNMSTVSFTDLTPQL